MPVLRSKLRSHIPQHGRNANNATNLTTSIYVCGSEIPSNYRAPNVSRRCPCVFLQGMQSAVCFEVIFFCCRRFTFVRSAVPNITAGIEHTRTLMPTSCEKRSHRIYRWLVTPFSSFFLNEKYVSNKFSAFIHCLPSYCDA